jgi:hypothetical protein
MLLQDVRIHLTHQIQLDGTPSGHQYLNGIKKKFDVLAGVGIAARETNLPGLEELWGGEKD